MVNKVQILVIALRKHTLPTDIMVPKKTKLDTIWTDMKVKIGIQIEFIAMVITHTMINTQVE
jgi:hypothetical protein